MHLGIQPSEFWKMTPYQSRLASKTFKHREQSNLHMAWHAGIIGRLKHPPKLSTLLGLKPRCMSPQEIIAQAEIHNQRLKDRGKR